MIIYLISNNLVLNDINYETPNLIDEKRKCRPLAIEGEILAQKLTKVVDGEVLYASEFASAISSAKYLAKEKNLLININPNLNDSKIGNMGRHNLKMLRFMQDKNFDYKYVGGESLNETKNRINSIIDKIIKKASDAIIFTHKRAIMSFLFNYCEKGYNLDEHLILSYNDIVILDDAENDMDIIKIEINNEKIVNIENIDIEKEGINNESRSNDWN